MISPFLSYRIKKCVNSQIIVLLSFMLCAHLFGWSDMYEIDLLKTHWSRRENILCFFNIVYNQKIKTIRIYSNLIMKMLPFDTEFCSK